MKKEQLHKQLKLIHKDLTKAEGRMQKIATKLNIDGHEYIERTLWEVLGKLTYYNHKHSHP